MSFRSSLRWVLLVSGVTHVAQGAEPARPAGTPPPPPPTSAASPATAAPKATSSAPSTATPAASEPAAPSGGSAPETVPVSSSATLDLGERARKAMLHFNLGAVDEAYGELVRVVLDCDQAGDSTCDAKREATLYRDVGIVLAGGRKQHDAGVQAFKKAISLDPLVTIPQEYRSEKVNRAFAEALYGPERRIPPELASTTPLEQIQKVHEPERDVPKGPRKTGFFFVEATGKLGAAGTTETDCIGDECFEDSVGTASLGAAGTIGGLPFDNAFAVAGRVRAGAYSWQGQDRSPLGFFGTAGLAGAVFGDRRANRFAYVLGGPGFENHPATGEFLFTTHVLGGVSLNGFDVGGGLDVAIGEVEGPTNGWGSAEYSYLVLFGLHVGYASLF